MKIEQISLVASFQSPPYKNGTNSLLIKQSLDSTNEKENEISFQKFMRKIPIVPIDHFKSSLYTGKAILTAINGVGINIYSIPENKCVKNWLVDPTTFFISSPLYESNESVNDEGGNVSVIGVLSSNPKRAFLYTFVEGKKDPVVSPLPSINVFSIQSVVNGNVQNLLLFSSQNHITLFDRSSINVIDQAVTIKGSKIMHVHDLGFNQYYAIYESQNHTIFSVMITVQNGKISIQEKESRESIKKSRLIAAYGNVLVTATKDGQIKIIDTEKGTGFSYLQLPEAVDAVCLQVISHDYFGLIGKDSKELLIFDMNYGLAHLRVPLLSTENDIITDFSYCFDEYIFVTGPNGIFSVNSGRIERLSIKNILGKNKNSIFNEESIKKINFDINVQSIAKAPSKLSPDMINYVMSHFGEAKDAKQTMIFLLDTNKISTWDWDCLLDKIIELDDFDVYLSFIKNILDVKEEDIVSLLTVFLNKLKSDQTEERAFILIYSLLSCPVTSAFMSAELQRLSFDQVKILLDILVDLVNHFDEITQSLKNAHNNKSPFLILPTYAQVLEYVAYLLDGHLVDFLLRGEEMLEFMQKLKTFIELEIEGYKQLSSMRDFTKSYLDFYSTSHSSIAGAANDKSWKSKKFTPKTSPFHQPLSDYTIEIVNFQ